MLDTRPGQRRQGSEVQTLYRNVYRSNRYEPFLDVAKRTQTSHKPTKSLSFATTSKPVRCANRTLALSTFSGSPSGSAVACDPNVDTRRTSQLPGAA